MSPNDVGEQILIVEDDPEMGELLHRGLTAAGYEVSLTTDGVEALIVAASTDFGAAIVDVMLPGMTGFELCRRLKESGGPVRVLLLTARNSVDDRVFGLDSGADDYLTKPFAFAELSARIRALLRREDPTVKLVLNVGAIRLDSSSLTVNLGDAKITLSPKEFSVLRLLATHHGEPVSRSTMLHQVWGGSANIDNNIVDQYVSYLRRKLAAFAPVVTISTIRGEGYVLETTS